jgi:putative hemolysin
MKELPSPTLPLLTMLDFRSPHRTPPPIVVDPMRSLRPARAPGTEVIWVRHQDDLRAAQGLRHQVFAQEMGATLRPPVGTAPGLDVDLFDDFCEHLVVRTRPTDGSAPKVIGTYRVLTPGGARRAGGYYSDTEFDLTRLRSLRQRMAELGRSCVHPEHRSGAVILSLWAALADFMARNGLDTMVGCASVSMRDGGHGAASLWRQLTHHHLVEDQYRVRPRLALPVEDLQQDLAVEPPPLIKGYLRCGAKLLGAPAWDPDFNTADLPLLMRLADLPARYRQHFLGEH